MLGISNITSIKIFSMIDFSARAPFFSNKASLAICSKDSLVNLSSTLDSSEGGVYSENRDPKKVLLVTITSNRGLCGGFNANIIKKAKYLMEVDYKNIETDILSIGKKSTEHFQKNGYNVISSHDLLYSDLTFENKKMLPFLFLCEKVCSLFDGQISSRFPSLVETSSVWLACSASNASIFFCIFCACLRSFPTPAIIKVWVRCWVNWPDGFS